MYITEMPPIDIQSLVELLIKNWLEQVISSQGFCEQHLASNSCNENTRTHKILHLT
jgi:hypothetical protein